MMDSNDTDVSSKDFFPALVKSVRRLCQKHFSFKHSVEVVGLLCLNVDNEEKENYSIKELIQRPIGLRVEALSSNVNHSPSKDSRRPLGTANTNVSESEGSFDAACEENFETESSSQQMMPAEVNDSHGESEYFSDDDDEECFDGDAHAIEPDTSTDNISASETVSSSQETVAACPLQTTLSHSIDHLEDMEVPVVEQTICSNGMVCSTKKMNKEFSFVQKTPHILFSDFSAMYPTISMRTFYRWKKEIADGMDLIRNNGKITFSEFQNCFPEVSEEVFGLWKDLISKQSHNASSLANFSSADDKNVEHLKEDNPVKNVPNSSRDEWMVQKIDSEEKIKIILKNKPPVPNVEKTAISKEICDINVNVVKRLPQSHLTDINKHELADSESTAMNMKESPSVFGNKPSESDSEIQDSLSNKSKTESARSDSVGACGPVTMVPDVSYSDPMKMEFTDSEEEMQINVQNQLDSPKRKLELEVDATVVPSPSSDSTHTSVTEYGNVDVMTNCVRKKRKYSSMDGIQHRREVYQKEEYELLEAMPFADYAEFSRHCPNVMKRTYFRWKRRIKEEYMYLEQNSDMSFEDFSRVFPQAKQNIFSHWKTLIKQGYNFSSVHYTSDATNQISSANNDTVDSTDDGVKQSSYNFLQKNYQMEFADFSKHFPSVTQQTFAVWKKKIQHEVQFLMSNPYYDMDYAVYSQCFPGVSNEVFTAWKRNMQQQLGSPQSAVYPAASYWSPYLGQAARFGSVAWPDMKPGLWMNNPLLTHMWGTAMNLSALARSEDANKQQQLMRTNSSVEETSSNRNSKATPSPSLSSGHPASSELGTSSTKHSPFTQSETDFVSPRSRKQNKAEFYHFLQHPEMDFHDMSVAFPNLSLRTFYRWKREIKNAMCILEESNSTPFTEFHIYFPDIPVDIFNKWKEKISGTDQASCSDSLFKSTSNNSVSRSDSSSTKTAFTGISSISDSDVKNKGTEFQFLEVNPDISFSQFTLHFPHVPLRTFYSWCKEIQDQINHIRQNPSISVEEFHQLFPHITSEVFHVWRDIVYSEQASASKLECNSLQINLEGSSVKSQSPGPEPGEVSVSPTDLSNKHEQSNHYTDNDYQRQKMLMGELQTKLIHKASRPEYVFLQNNPTIDFREFFLRFPEVSGTTFYRWRREIKEIMDYIQLKPNTTYNEVVSYFPEISEDVFAHWKSVIQSGACNPNVEVNDSDPMGSLQAMVDSRTGDDTQEAFCIVLENPDIDKDEFWQKYPCLSQKLYYKWKKKVKELLLLLHGNPEMDYSTFSTCSSDVPEGIFSKWKENLSVYVDKAVSSGMEETTDTDTKSHSSEDWTSPKTRKVNQAEFLFFLMNPFMDYQEFSNNFPQISLRTFYRWRRETRDGLEYLEEYPDVSYKAFCQVFPVVPEDVFEKWKILISVRNKVKNKACYQNDVPREASGIHVKDTDNLSEKTFTANDHFVHPNSSNTAKSKASTEEGLVDDTHNSHQETDAINNSDSSSSSPQGNHKSDSSGSFIGFLSAAVENICKSAGLPPLDQSDSSNDSHNNRVARPRSSVSAPLKLGGVAFPGLVPSDTDRAVSNSPSNMVSDHASPSASTPNESEPAGLGGIAFPGMIPASCYSISSANTVMPVASVLNNSASSHQNSPSSIAKTQLIESDSYNHGLSNVNFPEYGIPSASGFWPFDRQVIKSEPLASSPTSDPMNLGTSGVTSPSFGLEIPSSSRNILNAVKTESPISGIKSVTSASGKNGLHDDYFFSPRLRKQNREEYLYLQQNPSMDFQEFYKVYPTISLRTFYRWKREFREDTLLGSFQQKENTNTLNTSGIQHSQILDLSAKPGNVYSHSADSEIL